MITKKYRINSVNAPRDLVQLYITPILTEPTEPKVRVEPLPQNETDKIVGAMMKTLEKRYPIFAQAAQGQQPVPANPAFILNLTSEEYDELGRPTVHEILSLSIEKVQNETYVSGQTTTDFHQ